MSLGKANIEYQFTVPSDYTMEIAKRLVESSDADAKNVAKAILDATEITLRTRAALMDKSAATYDLGPYFDHWFGDSLESAQRLSESDNEEYKAMGDMLISQSTAMASSKESFLNEAKRLKMKPDHGAGKG